LAFNRATLKSESYRIVGVLCLLLLLLLFVIVRGLAIRYSPQLLASEALILVAVIVGEITMLQFVRRALRNETKIPLAVRVIDVLVETQVPTIALLLLIESRVLSPRQALVAPTILLYLLFIILSTLRLNPILSVLTGLSSALGYLTMVLLVESVYPSSTTDAAIFPLRVYFVYAGMILVSGIVAALVANEIRKHVRAALREAELQAELERMNHDLGIAQSIQQGLLPSSAPKLDRFEIAGWNQPADQTGGDYFDWQQLPDGRLAISLGDATGHGIGPALVSTSCRAYARASVLAGNEQNGLLNRLNQLLADDLSANRFVTFVVVFLDPARAEVKVLSAGHGPILYYRRAADAIENLEAQGIPLGMIASISYEHASERQLEPGDMLVLVTDGFYEWEDPDEQQFGMARLENVIRESRDYSAQEVIACLRTAVETFCKGTKQQDDLTAVVIKRKLDPPIAQL